MNQPQLGSFESIALAAIRPSPTNPRKNFDPVALAELTRSIEEMGVTVPILVRPIVMLKKVELPGGAFGVELHGSAGAFDISYEPDDELDPNGCSEMADEYIRNNQHASGEFEIVSGERRFRAAKDAGLAEIPAQIRKLSDADARDIQLVENLNRADLHPVEEAEGYRALMASGASTEDVAKKAGKTSAYVQQRLKLLSLELPVKTLFHEGHLTLGHAITLARLQPADQERALLMMLNVPGPSKGKTMMDVVTERLTPPDNSGFSADMAERWDKEWRARRRVDTTESQLGNWVRENILLSLAGVPWSLTDELLVPEAGACTTCPKRTGSNGALFADITADQDVCLDAACFATKHKAMQLVTITAAAEAGTPLLKLSAKAGHKETEWRIDAKAPPSKKPLQFGQWLKVEPESCLDARKGLLVDEPSTWGELKDHKNGDVLTVCANQKCKVHKHTVEKPAAINGSGTAAPKRDEAAAVRRVLIQTKVTAEAVKLILTKDAQRARMLEMLVGDYVDRDFRGNESDLCKHLGINVPAPKGAKNLNEHALRYQLNEAAKPLFEKFLATATLPELHDAALYVMVADAEDECGYGDEEMLRKIAKRCGVDLEAVTERVEAAVVAEEKALAETAAKAVPETPKPAAKKAAAKKTAAKKKPAVDGKSAGAGAAVEARQS